jgi:hypothetical protein
LNAVTGSGAGTINLTWTTPGDDGTLNTLPLDSQYRIHHTTVASQATNPLFWSTAAAQVVISTNGVAPGVNVSTTLASLILGTTYYFRMWTRDEVPNWSGLSNGATAQAQVTVLSVTVSTSAYNFGSVNLMGSTISISSVTVTNSGNIIELYSVRATTITAGSPWQIGTSQALNTFVLQAGFNGNTQPPPPSFGGEDKLSQTDQLCTATKFAIGESCVSVPVGATRGLWFRLDMPSASTTIEEQEIQVTITASL